MRIGTEMGIRVGMGIEEETGIKIETGICWAMDEGRVRKRDKMKLEIREIEISGHSWHGEAGIERRARERNCTWLCFTYQRGETSGTEWTRASVYVYSEGCNLDKLGVGENRLN